MYEQMQVCTMSLSLYGDVCIVHVCVHVCVLCVELCVECIVCSVYSV